MVSRTFHQKLFIKKIGSFQKCFEMTDLFYSLKVRYLISSCAYNIKFSRNYCNKKISAGICWNCKYTTETKDIFFCNKCRSLQDPPKDVNFFNFFSVKQQYLINIPDLTKKFRKLQFIVHPDKFINKHKMEQVSSQEWSSLINKAYKTLVSPIERGHYMLALNGLKIPQNSSFDGKFLVKVMEFNEKIEVANNNELSKLLKIVRNELNEEMNNCNKSFENNNLIDARMHLSKMIYFKNIEETVKKKIQYLLDSSKNI